MCHLARWMTRFKRRREKKKREVSYTQVDQELEGAVGVVGWFLFATRIVGFVLLFPSEQLPRTVRVRECCALRDRVLRGTEEWLVQGVGV